MKSPTTTITILLALHHPVSVVRANTRCPRHCRGLFDTGRGWLCLTGTTAHEHEQEHEQEQDLDQLEGGGSLIITSSATTNYNNVASLHRIARGGATIDATSFTNVDDEDLDQLVDELIAGLGGADVDGEGGDEDRAARASSGGVMPPANEEDSDAYESEEHEVASGNDTDELRIVDEDQSAILEQGNVDRGVTTAQIDDSKEQCTPRIMTERASSTIRSNGSRSSTDLVADRRSTAGSSLRSSALSNLSTPTNAYYRFVVRRGPRGHILASLTLVAVQFVYTYLPVLYQSIASSLLRLHVYDTRVLYEKDRQRQLRTMYGPKKKQGGGLTSKIFGVSRRTEKRQRMKEQKRSDEEAANKLKQLYRTMKIGNGLGMLSEVKYRYLSVAFRRKHGLGREYRIEKPRTFMGEVVEGSVSAILSDKSFKEGMELNVISDDDADEEARGEQQHIILSSIRTDQSTMRRGIRSRRQPLVNKQKIIHDWVVNAFASHRNPLTGASIASSSNDATDNRRGESSATTTSSLWKTVDRAAIIEAAWESCAAEQSVPKQRERRRVAALRDCSNSSYSNDQKTTDENNVDAAFETGRGTAGGGYSASKVFQSVMTRVGSNGRIFGAYPNDAPPIEQCAHKRGVMGLARRYGYGNWKSRIDEPKQQDNSDDDSWGGGDLI